MKEKRNEVYSEDSKLKKSLDVHKTDLIHYIQHTVGLSENKAKIIIKKTFEWIVLNLALNKKVFITEFGVFYNTYVKSKNCSHPSTKEEYVIEEMVRVVFKPEKRLKNSVQFSLNELKQENVKEGQKLSPHGEEIKTKLDTYYEELKEYSKYNPTHRIKQERHNHEAHVVRSSMLTYLKEDFPYGRDWIHPITYDRYSCGAIKSALLILQELNPEKYRVLWALWTTRKDSIYLANKFYCSVQTIKRQWERAIDLLVLFLFFPELNADITNVTKLY